MKMNITVRDRNYELKYAFNSFKYIEELNLTELSEQIGRAHV